MVARSSRVSLVLAALAAVLGCAAAFVPAPAGRVFGAAVGRARVNMAVSASSPPVSFQQLQSAIASDSRFYNVTLPKSAGFDWSSDLSFASVFVGGFQPESPAKGAVNTGDLLVGVGESVTAGVLFPLVIDTISAQPGPEVQYVFFKGKKEAFLEAVAKAPAPPAASSE